MRSVTVAETAPGVFAVGNGGGSITVTAGSIEGALRKAASRAGVVESAPDLEIHSVVEAAWVLETIMDGKIPSQIAEGLAAA